MAKAIRKTIKRSRAGAKKSKTKKSRKKKPAAKPQSKSAPGRRRSPAPTLTAAAVDPALDNLQKIDKIVVLLMENRSFDHMLGYLRLEGNRNDVEGLTPGLSNSDGQKSYSIHHLDHTLSTQARTRVIAASASPISCKTTTAGSSVIT
jgi:phospholipase C